MFSGFTFLFIDDDDDAFLLLPNNKPICVSSRARAARVLSLSLFCVACCEQKAAVLPVRFFV